MTPESARAWLSVGVIAAGIILTVYGFVTGTLLPWHLPLLAGMMGIPLVAASKIGRNRNGPRNG